MKTTSNKLTLNKMKKLYGSVLEHEGNFTIKWWQEPFLWLIWCVKGYTYTTENLEMYWVEFRGVKYLLKSKEVQV